MSKVILSVLFALSCSFAISYQNAQKECFDDGNASFAYKTKEQIVLYGDKMNPKISFVRYNVINNPNSDKTGYPDKYFYLIDLPKEILSVFFIKNWNDFLCGDFLPYAYPNVNDLTSIQLREDVSHVSHDDKFYFFRAVPVESGVITAESIDSFSMSIPGNMGYNHLYPLSKIYPYDYVEKYDKNTVMKNNVFTKVVDALIKMSKIKDFEDRRNFVKKLKDDKIPLVSTIERFNDYVDEFNDIQDVNQKMNVYKDVDRFLSELDYKFNNARHLLTRNSEAFAEAVHIFYKNFDKEASRYLKKIKEKKNKDTEKNLMDFSEKTLNDAIGMIQRGVERLGNSVNAKDRQVAFLLNDYETAYSKYLDKIKSGNHGAIKVAKNALGDLILTYSFVFDIKKNSSFYELKEDYADEDGWVAIYLDDGTALMLFEGSQNGDSRLLIRFKYGYGSMSSLVFDVERKTLDKAFVTSEYVYGNYLPPMQVVYSGKANNLVLFDSTAQLLNKSTFPKEENFYTKEGIAYLNKIKCVFEAVDGDMKELRRLVGARTKSIPSGTLIEKNEKFQNLRCSNGKIFY